MLSSLTNCEEAIDLILTQNRKSREESVNYGLFLTTPEAEAQIPPEVGILDEFKWTVNYNNLNYRTTFAFYWNNGKIYRWLESKVDIHMKQQLEIELEAK